MPRFAYPFIHWWTLGLLLNLLTTVTHAAMNMGVQMSFWDLTFNSFWHIPRRRFAGSYGNSGVFSSFIEIQLTYSTVYKFKVYSIMIWLNIYCEMMPSSHRDRKERLFFFLVMRTLRKYFNNFHVYHTAVLTIIITLYITSLVLVIVFLILGGNCHAVFHSSCTIFTPATVAQGFQFLPILPNTSYFLVLFIWFV